MSVVRVAAGWEIRNHKCSIFFKKFIKKGFGIKKCVSKKNKNKNETNRNYNHVDFRNECCERATAIANA
jgi:hypothetical protein